MIARTFEELDAWQLAVELKNSVEALLATSHAKRDGNFCDQIRSSSASAPANISEGFGYYEHPQFARHVRIAIATLDETRHHLRDGVERCFWSGDNAAPLIRLAKRARGACVGLLAHLCTTDAPQPWTGTPLRPKQRRRK
jgi:four helix bundle protein